MPYRPEPTPPGETSDSMMLTRTVPPPSGFIESWAVLTDAGRGPGRRRGEHRCPRERRTAPPCLPCSPPLTCSPATAWTWRLGWDSNCHASSTEPIQSRRHHGGEHVALLAVADQLAERARQGERDHEQQDDLEQVREGVRVLERVRRVRVVEAAAVGAEFLDRLPARPPDRRGSTGSAPWTVVTSLGSLRFWTTPCEIRTTRADERDRQQDPDVLRTRSAQKLPIVSASDAGEPADQRDGDRDADGRRHEVLHGEPRHLHQVTHRRLARVGLPVRVGDERDGGVERLSRTSHRGTRATAATTPGRAARTYRNSTDRQRERQERDRVRGPPLLDRRGSRPPAG